MIKILLENWYWIVAAGAIGLLAGWILYAARARRISREALTGRPGKTKTAHFDEFEIHYTQSGQGPHIVLLHGIGASLYTWRFLEPLLSKKHTVTSIDLPGFGSSSKHVHKEYDLDAQAKRISQFLLSIGVDGAILVGSSMGGAIALWMARGEPSRFRNVITLAPAVTPRLTANVAHVAKFFSGSAQKILTPRAMRMILPMVIGDKRHIHEESIHTYLRPYLENEHAGATFIKATSVLRDRRLPGDLADVSSRVLILQGSKDRLVPRSSVEKLQRIIPGSRLEFHPDAGHHSMEDDPTWVAEKILEFLESKS